jgi:hypothetical protein
MDYRYNGDVKKLQGHDPVGTGECVALVQRQSRLSPLKSTSVQRLISSTVTVG